VEQLTTLDAGFLEAEDSDRHVSLAIGGLAVIDGPAPNYDVLVATLAGRVPSIPGFTQVLHTHLFDLGAPEWVDDARFDNVIPFPFTAWTVRALTRLPQRGVVTLATNVLGPRKRVRVMGREVIRLLPIPPLALQLRTGIAILSNADHVAFGIIGDYDAAPDVDELARGIERAVARLTAVSAGYWRSTPVGTLALVHGG
jgi:hypothetical protein